MASMATSETGDSIEPKKISDGSNVQPKAKFPPFILRPAAALTPAEKDKLERHGSIVSAQNALLAFKPTLDDDGPQREQRGQAAQNKRNGHKKVLEGLRKVIRNVVDAQNAPSSPSFFSSFRKGRQQTLGRDDFQKLVEVAHDAFPPRMDIPVLVCDVKLEGAAVYSLELKDIEKCWKKPEGEGIIVRWIHVPLGNGVVHSSIEDMFRYDQPDGRPFRHAGIPGFPFLDLETPHLRDVKELKHMRHVYQELHQLRDLHDYLTKTCFDNDRNKTFSDDIRWRLKHLGQVPDYWETVLTDIPLELSETFGSSGGEGPIRPPSLGKGPLDPSVLGEDDGPYKDTHLVWAPFRCFHRNDGTLLTMSAATGVNLLHRDFRLHLEQTLLDRIQNPDASVVGSQMRALKAHGAKNWYQLTVEYFLVHLITEIAITPHNMYSGHSAPSLLSALQSRIKDLNKRRFEEWNGKESEKLVKDYISCLDQLRALSASYGRKLAIFENLKKDVKDHESQDQKAVKRALKEEQRLALQQAISTDQSSVHTGRVSAPDTLIDVEEQEEDDDDELRGTADRRIHNKKGTTPTQRIQWAVRIIDRDKKLADSLIEETSRAMQAFFQLRSIEQNERQINNESRNYAVFIFTGVTVVFLPLSFFCSYYGMNLKGIVDTTESESYFWKFGGSLTVVIVALISLCAFGHAYWSEQIKAAKLRLKKRRMEFKEKDIESQAQRRMMDQEKDDLESQARSG